MPASEQQPLITDRRRLQGLRSREDILDAAARIMSLRGYDGTSISAISRETGLPNSSIYWHFESKAAILAAVMERGAGRFFAAASVDVAGAPDGDAEDRLHWALHRATDSLNDHAEFLRLFILLALSNDDPDIADVVRRVRHDGKQQLHGLIEFAFAEAGTREAERVADELVGFAIAAFDGIFIAAQFDPNLMHREGTDQMASALAHLGRALLRGD